GTIYAFDEARGSFVVRASDGVDAEIVERLQARGGLAETAIIGQAAMQRQPTQVPDLWEAGGTLDGVEQELGFRALLAVPLLKEGSVVGGIVLRRREPGDFEPETISLLQTIAVQSVLAVGPHGVAYENRWSIETRGQVSSPPLDVARLRGEVQRSIAGAAETAGFRKDRLALVRANQGPVEFPPSAKVVVHLVPTAGGGPAARYDLYPAVRYLAPLGR